MGMHVLHAFHCSVNNSHGDITTTELLFFRLLTIGPAVLHNTPGTSKAEIYSIELSNFSIVAEK